MCTNVQSFRTSSQDNKAITPNIPRGRQNITAYIAAKPCNLTAIFQIPYPGEVILCSHRLLSFKRKFGWIFFYIKPSELSTYFLLLSEQEYFYVQVMVVADKLRHLKGNDSEVL